jgi:hypothetical protein
LNRKRPSPEIRRGNKPVLIVERCIAATRAAGTVYEPIIIIIVLLSNSSGHPLQQAIQFQQLSLASGCPF